MNNLEKVNSQTSDKIKELQLGSLNGRGSLMSIIRLNIKNWEKNLKPVCKSAGKSYQNAVSEILVASGYEVDKKKLNVYLNRAKKGE